jgi:hypothetical protein
MTDYAKRLAEIKERVVAVRPGAFMHHENAVFGEHALSDVLWLLGQIRAASGVFDKADALTHMIGVGPPDAHPATLAERAADIVAMRDHAEAVAAATSDALTAAGVPDDMGTIAERIAWLRRAADSASDYSGMALLDMKAASDVLTAAGIADDGRSLAERVEMLATERDMARGLNEQNVLDREAQRAKGAALEADVARLSAVKSAEIAPLLDKFVAAFGADTPMTPSWNAAEIDAALSAALGAPLPGRPMLDKVHALRARIDYWIQAWEQRDPRLGRSPDGSVCTGGVT